MKLIIAGHGEHGKDEVCKLLEERGLSFTSSSEFASDLFIFDALKDKYGYKTSKECFEDRRNHRTEWYDLICEYNREDPARLARAIFAEFDVYAGIRNHIELRAAKEEGLYDTEIWVDASDRVIAESTDSNKLTEEECAHKLNNNGPLENLPDELDKVLKKIHDDQAEEIAMRNYIVRQQRESARRAIVTLIARLADSLCWRTI